MTDANYTPIRVATLRGDIKIPFDVYVRVAGKYIHYCRAGDSFEGLRLERLKAKKLKKMYIRPEDEIPYQQYLEQSIDSAYDSKSGKSLDIRAEVIQGFQMAATEQYIEEPRFEFSYNHIKSSVQRFTEFLSKEPKGATSILKLMNSDSSVTHHSVNVATLTVMMTTESKFKETAQMNTLALGCMVHDIEHIFEERDMSKPLSSYTKEEMQIYKEHPLRAAKRLQDLDFVDQLVMKIILQHEENSDGTGFPKGLVERDMEPLILIAATANAYDRLTSFEKMNPKDALKHLMIEKLGLYPLPILQTLQKVLKQLQML